MGRMTSVRMVLAVWSATCVLQAQAAPSMTVTVHFAPTLSAEAVHDILAVTGVTVVAHPQQDTYTLTGKRRARAEQLATLFAAIPGVTGTDPVAPHHPEDDYQPVVAQNIPMQSDSFAYPVPSAAASRLGANASVMGFIPLQGTDVQVQFHPWADDKVQRQFQTVFQASTVRRMSRFVLIVRPGNLSAAAAVRAFSLVPAVRHAEPHYGS